MINKFGGLIFANFKTYYETTVIKCGAGIRTDIEIKRIESRVQT